ncbi:hypothetical protein LJ655_28875 [Paraburkholderia sp. MMS20-SJTN17]|uniref:Ig-like domain-containing protein n=1 Tax=Paraburkholderia translucens TaxID=2886945 RepID=A0ABS8KN63_9BURK|nr:hypothetical protein [Paraburkholderia sp. MMS20-SJTN17]MCC8405822.1 hypothetical protein [Paraburkholderia sp. MMS20-SJTN17]
MKVRRVKAPSTIKRATSLAVMSFSILVAACGGGGNDSGPSAPATNQTGSQGTTGTSGGTSTNAQAPVIGTQPSNSTTAVDSSASFSVTASGAGPLSYQWRRNGVAIDGATSASYTTPALAVADGDSKYDVVVSGPGGSVTSSQASVSVSLHSGMNRLIGQQKTAGASDGDSASALFNAPAGTVTDINGNIFVADAGNFTIRKIDPTYAVTTLAGKPGVSGFQDGTGQGALFGGTGEWIDGHLLSLGNVPVASADRTVRAPQKLSVDTDQNILLADAAHNVLRKVTQAGVVTTFAGTPNTPGTGDGPTSTALLNLPLDVAADGAATTYFVDVVLPPPTLENYSIRKVTSSAQGRTVSRAWTSMVDEPILDISVHNGTLYFISGASVSPKSTNGLYKLNSDGTATMIAGDTGSPVPTLPGAPSFLAAGNDGMLYVVESPLTKIYRVNPNGTVTLLFDYSATGLSGVLRGMSVTADDKNLLLTIDNALFLLPLTN